jgi:DNA invertase Pin-like site-specific DNA recombinase
MSESVAYIRVSTDKQNLTLQQDAMKAAGIDKVFVDNGVSGSLARREGLDAALDYLREGDTLVVWRLDRLGRNTRNVLELLDDLASRGIKFRSITEGLDTSGPMGRLMLTIMSAFAQLERDVIRERTNAGLEAARSRGKVGGRPAALNEKQHKMVRSLHNAQELTIKEIAEQMTVSEGTVYRSLRTTKPVGVVGA